AVSSVVYRELAVDWGSGEIGVRCKRAERFGVTVEPKFVESFFTWSSEFHRNRGCRVEHVGRLIDPYVTEAGVRADGWDGVGPVKCRSGFKAPCVDRLRRCAGRRQSHTQGTYRADNQASRPSA